MNCDKQKNSILAVWSDWEPARNIPDGLTQPVFLSLGLGLDLIGLSYCVSLVKPYTHVFQAS